MTDTTSITQVYYARNNLLAILEECGYDISEYNNYGIQQVNAMMDTNQLDLLLTKPSGKKVFVKYNLDTKLNVSNIVCPFFDEENPILTKEDDLIIIVKADPNDTMIASIEALWNDSKIYVSVINIRRLLFNILKHTQVPKHEVLSESEKNALYIKHHIKTDADLPYISRYDPVALALCIRPGMVCRIHRKSKSAVITYYYRVCV